MIEPNNNETKGASGVASSDLLGAAIEWKSADEYPLGRIEKTENDGNSIREEFTLFAGYEKTKLFATEIAEGGYEEFVGSIDDHGSVCDTRGNDVGWAWDDISHWAEFNSPNASE